MTKLQTLGAIFLLLLLTGCARPQPEAGAAASPVSGPAAAPKRITAAVLGEPATLSTRVNFSGPGGVYPGAEEMQDLVHAGLSIYDNRGELRPRLAEAVPTLENGGWRLLADGRMELSWTLRPDTTWHDGAPFTADDLVFTVQVDRDRDVPLTPDVAYEALGAVELADARTLRATWNRPYIYADAMFGPALALPMPRHVLAGPYAEDRASLLQRPYWSTEFVGLGPFRLKEWTRGSYLVLEANDRFPLGRPQVDTIEIRFIPDAKSLGASVLAGTAELTLGRALSIEQALQVRDQWRDGAMLLYPRSWVITNPQMLDPSPPIILDVRFRRALLYAIDRQEIVDTLQHGLVEVAHGYLNPNEPDYPAVERFVVRYGYDPRRAAAGLEELGYARSPDGTLLDAAGQPLSIETRTVSSEAVMLSIADYWQRQGISVTPSITPPQRRQDREYRATWPGFEVQQNSNDPATLSWQHSSQVPLPSNNYSGRSKNRYMNPEFDALVDRYYATIPRPERAQVLGQIVHHISDQLISMPIFYQAEPMLVGHRLRNVQPQGPGSTSAWNAHEWNVASSKD